MSSKLKSRRKVHKEKLSGTEASQDPVKGSKEKQKAKKRRFEEDEEEIVGERLTKKILKQAARQQKEIEEEPDTGDEEEEEEEESTSFQTALRRNSDEDEDENDKKEEDDYNMYQEEELLVDPEDEKIMESFMSKNPPSRLKLADLLMERLTEKKTEVQSVMSVGSFDFQDMDERVLTMFRDVGKILSKYRSGKLPKAFKIIPSMSNWEQVLHLTMPDKWTAAAMYQATRIFSSNLNAKMAQRFYNLVLLPRVRDDIAEYKRLNFHLYQALNQSLFKPAAFYKGIIIPLCESGTCTLREAVIVASVIARHSVPMLHSAAALLRLAEMTYTGATSVFMRTLLDKKYALPYRVLDALVAHFLQFENQSGQYPVLWHQCLLCFCQRYKEDISFEQKEALGRVAKVHKHFEISPLIHNELAHAKSRETEMTMDT